MMEFWESGLLAEKMKLNCGAERQHYSMFDVGRSMLDVNLLKQAPGMVLR